MKNKILLLAVLVSVTLSACEKFLDEPPQDQVFVGAYYSDRSEAIVGLNSAYVAAKNDNFLVSGPLRLVTDYTRQRIDGIQPDPLWSYTHNADNPSVRSMWVSNYAVIAAANLNIERIELNEAKIQGAKDLIGQARTLRAIAYFNLVRMWGPVPLLTKASINFNPELDKLSRSSEEDVYKLIIEDLEYAQTNCLLKEQTEFGRITRGFATGLLAKVYLTLGSTDKRDGKGNGKSYFTKSAEECRKIIGNTPASSSTGTMGSYRLLDYYPDNFIREMKVNDETLWSIGFEDGPGVGGTVGTQTGFVGNGNQLGSVFAGSTNATDYAVDVLFDRTDSVRRFWTMERAQYRNIGGKWVLQTSERQVATPALANRIMTMPIFYRYGQAAITNNPAFPPIAIGKYRRYPRLPATYFFEQYGMNLPVMRYSEVLLMLAEATSEINDGPTAESYAAVNLVRARARNNNALIPGKNAVREDVLPRALYTVANNVPNFSGMNYATFKEAILDERSRELLAEWNVRWFDLVRIGELHTRVNKLRTYQNITYNRTESDFASINPLPFHYRLPIPFSELQLNPNLKQNLGY